MQYLQDTIRNHGVYKLLSNGLWLVVILTNEIERNQQTHWCVTTTPAPNFLKHSIKKISDEEDAAHAFTFMESRLRKLCLLIKLNCVKFIQP